MPNRKTERMLQVEAQLQRDYGPTETLEGFIARMVPEKGLQVTADLLGVSRQALQSWILRLGLERQVSYAVPGQEKEAGDGG